MEQRELDFIASTEFMHYNNWRKDPKNQKVLSYCDALYSELNALGYNIFWGFQMQPTMFNGDIRIFPIVKKYVDKAGMDEELQGFVCSAIWILAHKNMTVATEYLIKKYKENVEFSKNNIKFNDRILSIYTQAIAKIRDKQYITEYIQLTDPLSIELNAGPLVELLGKLKVYEAEDRLIQLLDYRSPAPLYSDEKYHYDMGLNTVISRSAMRALGYLKSKKALPVIEKYLNPEQLQGFFPENKDRKGDITTTKNLAKKVIQKING